MVLRWVQTALLLAGATLGAACSDDPTVGRSSPSDISIDTGDAPADVPMDGSSVAPDVGASLDVAGPPCSGCDASEDTGATDALFDVAEPFDVAAVVDAGSPVDAPPPAADAADIAGDTGAADAPDSVDTSVAPLTIAEKCFAPITAPEAPPDSGPQYDQFAPVVADHCWGTNHQDIQGVELVVFLGDSVTVGTPNLEHALPTDNEHLYRSKLATWLRDHFGLDDGGIWDFGVWKTYDFISNTSGKLEAGDFRNCSKWGARTDDFLAGGNQIGKCFPDGGSDKRTLVVFTMGGNDISKISQVGGDASPEEVANGYPEAWALAESTIVYLREAVEWLKDPARFPNGSYVIFANPFEFTDGTGDVSACPVAGLAGYKVWEKPEIQEAIVVHVLEAYMQIAVDTQTDLLWLLEHFCGHGYVATGPNADPENRCYRGPDAELYFDDTCIHPNEAGHNALFEMFRDTVLE